jgi:hypothetical protein
MNTENNLEFLDILNIIGFVIGVANYEENLTQGDKQDLMQAFDKQTSTLLSDLHKHLDEQDRKIDMILEVLNNDKDKKVSGTH